MNRFRRYLQVLLFAGMLGIFAYGFSSTQTQVKQQDLQRVKEAIQKAALECYSIEGRYPRQLEYLEQNYGLYIQEDLYHVRYEFIAGNIMPKTNVYAKEV